MLINQANARIVVYVSVAAFILVFSLVATKTLVNQAAYQNRVIKAKRAAVTQLKSDIAATTDLKNSYNAFISTTQNAIGGSASGTGAQDGDNAKIILNALPSTYDFPGLTTSLESLAGSQGAKITNITGTDDEVAQGTNTSSTAPQPVPIPFNIAVAGDYPSIQNVVSAFERSIRPMQVHTLDISAGSDGKLAMTLDAQTYYQPAKSLNIKTRIVR
jgi:Tfp pilus assembly protein PilO